MTGRVAQVRRGLAAGALGALLALPVLGGPAGAVAPPEPAGPFQKITWVMATLGTGPIKGIATIESGTPGRVRYAFHGLPATGTLRAVASTRPCSQPHVASAKVLGWSWGESNAVRTAAGQFMVEISGVNAGFIRSVRVLRGKGTLDQRACSNTSRWEVAPPSHTVTLENTMVSSFLAKPGPRGLAALRVVDEDTVQVRAELLHKDRGTFRLVGSTTPCTQAHTGSAKAFSVDYSLGDTGTHEVGHFMNATRTLAKPADEIRSLRLLRKSGGTFQPVECRGIIAVLIGL